METEKIKKLFDDFQKNYARYKVLPRIVQSVYLNIFSAQIARAAGMDIPLLELSRNSKVWSDRFSDFNNTSTIRNCSSWCTGGVTNLNADNMYNDYIDYCSDVDTLLLPREFSDMINLGALINACYYTGGEDIDESEDVLLQLADAEEISDEDERSEAIEELYPDMISCVGSLMYEHCENGMCFPDNLCGEIAESCLKVASEEFFGSYEAISDEFLKNLTYNMLCCIAYDESSLEEGNTVNCTFYVHPHGNEILKKNEILQYLYDFITDSSFEHQCRIRTYTNGDELALSVTYADDDCDMGLISIAFYAFLMILDNQYKHELSSLKAA